MTARSARFVRWVLALVLAVAAAGGAGAAAIQVKQLHVARGTTQVPVTEYTDGSGALHPCVFLLDAGKRLAGAVPMYAAYARALAKAGYNVYQIRYRTQAGDGAASTDPEAWSGVVGAVISQLSDAPNADPTRLGLLGFGQGADVAVAVAAGDPDVGAVVALSGGMPASVPGGLGRLPPTLILHGATDHAVPLSQAQKLADALSASGSRYDMVVYPGVGHDFSARLKSSAGRKALRRTVQFFNDNL